MAKYCHLSYEDRKNIEDGLNDNKSINQIAKEINRSHSSILREIDRNKVYFEPKQYGTYKNNNYDRDISCHRLSKSPYVCNGCKSRSGCRKEREILINRKYEDFIIYTNSNPDLNIVEMDTVVGLQEDSDCFLTLLWRKSKFMLIFKLENQTTKEVSRIFNTLQESIPYDDYKRLFQVILIDNGHEFFDVNNIECIQSSGEYITHLFFCDPHMSCQKGMIEKNHEFIRYILPKGSSFKNITQKDCNLIMNNINSLCRDSLNGKSPYEAMLFLFFSIYFS